MIPVPVTAPFPNRRSKISNETEIQICGGLRRQRRARIKCQSKVGGAAVDVPDIQQKLQKLEDTFAPLIGKINMKWGDAQFWVYVIFYYLMKEDILRSKAIFFALRSDDAQRKVTLAVAENILPFNGDATL